MRNRKCAIGAACAVALMAAVTALGASASTGGRAGAHPPVCKAGQKTTLKKVCAHRFAQSDCAKLTTMIKTATGVTVTVVPTKFPPLDLKCDYTAAGTPGNLLELTVYPGMKKPWYISTFNQYKNPYDQTCSDGSTPAQPAWLSSLGALAPLAYAFDPCPNDPVYDASDGHYGNMVTVQALHVTNGFSATSFKGLHVPPAKLVRLIRAMITKYP